MNHSRNFKKYQSKNPLKFLFINIFRKNIIKTIKSINGIGTVLDAGCGEGIITKNITNNFPGKKITGIDISENAVMRAKAMVPEVHFEKGDITALKYTDNFFDLTLALEVLEHLPNPEKALIELKRITKKCCLISVPWEPFFSLGNLLSGKNIVRLGNDPEHINSWSKKQITNLINEHFVVSYQIISFPWIITLANK